MTVFFRLDKGAEKVDHHCFFFFEGPRAPHVHHSSFETFDYNAQVLGHDWLRHKGYENCWGVGRHIMGSQIFDYWFDPSKFIMEHYADGDLMDNSYPTQRTLAGPGNLHVWGEYVPCEEMVMCNADLQCRTRRAVDLLDMSWSRPWYGRLQAFGLVPFVRLDLRDHGMSLF